MTLHYCFLEALFLTVLEQLKGYEEGDADQIALRWYEWLKKDSSESKVGSRRTALYDQVVAKAAKVCMHVVIMSLLINVVSYDK
ncbi:MAG TPA: hypothetical protein VGO47_08340 [Chlamydiales bacterium]|nr:hypothetical protein [Chlamydiales bacterium]